QSVSGAAGTVSGASRRSEMMNVTRTVCVTAGLIGAFMGGPQAVTQTTTAPAAGAQAPPAGRAAGPGRGGPAVVSPQIEADGRVTFRVLAPQATTVTVGGDIGG